MRPDCSWGTGVISLALAVVVAGCSGGGGGGPRCRFDDPAAFSSDAPWPKFHRDRENTGHIVLDDPAAFAALSSADKSARSFTGRSADAPFTASPVLSNDGSVVYIGSNDGALYAIDANEWTDRSFNLITAQPILAAGLVAVRKEADAIFVPSVEGRLHGVDASAELQESNWPFGGGIALDKAPNLGNDGTLYVGSSGGLFFGVCPNGVARFQISIGDATAVAIDPDSNVYVAGDDRQLRAIRFDGLPRWTFSASRPVATAPVLEVDGTTLAAVYVADTGGRVFKVDAQGRPIAGFYFDAGSAIRSTPALAGGSLYFGSDDGVIHAIASATGSGPAGWTVQTGGAVLSSPAVASFGDEKVIVVGSNDGGVYFLHESPGSAPTVQRFEVGAAVVSSPAIDFAGNVYVGAEDGRVYAITGGQS